MSDNSAYDITDGLADRALEDLSPGQQEVVMKLLARASERSYRRGFQQGAVLGPRLPRGAINLLADWRYGNSTDMSPAGDQPSWVRPAIELLHQENRMLYRIGLGNA